MRFVLFYHSLVSDWNHPSAHFLRGVATELLSHGHEVRILEPADGWSLHNLREQGGEGVVKAFHAIYPLLRSSFYDPASLNLDTVLADTDIVVAHEWNDPAFLARLGEHRARAGGYRLLFHDAPHRALQQPLDTRARVLRHFDGVLASSHGLRRMYEERGWAARVWTWMDAVDVRVFRPWTADPGHSLELVWVGSWGQGARSSELDEFLLEPIRTLRLRARFYGARFPAEVLRTLRASSIDYGGWIPDFSIPAALAAGRVTVNVPRRMRADGIPYTPAIRVLEALACRTPVVSAPWEEMTELFTPGSDLLIGRNGVEVQRHLVDVLGDVQLARSLTHQGYETVLSRHTCAHRMLELLAICESLGASRARRKPDSEHGGLVEPAAAPRSPAAWN